MCVWLARLALYRRGSDSDRVMSRKILYEIVLSLFTLENMERDSARTPTRLERITSFHAVPAREKAWLREATRQPCRNPTIRLAHRHVTAESAQPIGKQTSQLQITRDKLSDAEICD